MLFPSGLADPWAGGSKQEAEPPPSYDDITGGAIADPWATNVTLSVSAQPTQPVPLTDPWGGFPSSSSAAPPPQPQAIAE